MTKEVNDEFTVLWQQMQDFKHQELPELGKRINTAAIQQTEFRALQCYMRMKEGSLESWEDFLDNYRMLQRCLLEHEAFWTWHRERESRAMNDAYITLPCRPTHGVLCQAERQYFDCCQMNVMGYYYVDRVSIVLDPLKEV